jgi:hypothetical protein
VREIPSSGRSVADVSSRPAAGLRRLFRLCRRKKNIARAQITLCTIAGRPEEIKTISVKLIAYSRLDGFCRYHTTFCIIFHLISITADIFPKIRHGWYFAPLSKNFRILYRSLL